MLKKLMNLRMLSCMVLFIVVSPVVFAGDLRIEYSHAGLTDVKVDEKNRLHFSWHTRRLPFDENDISPMTQTIDAYDSHSASIWLTKAGLAKFEQWIVQNAIPILKSEYPEPETETYGSAFHSSLTVEIGGKKHSLSWTGDTKVPDTLSKAINDLVQMCHEIRKSREGK